jgi:predicted TIM-barrel fold metal-dependent hydrolase
MSFIAEQPLVDHHCHGVLLRDADEPTLEALLTEGGPFPGGSVFDSGIGLAFRRLCPPILGLDAGAPLADYTKRRAELGAAEVNRRFLRAAGLSALCVDTGYTPEPITSPAQLAELADAPVHEIVRLERIAEEVASTGVSATGFADAVREALAERATTAVGFKSIAAYRVGLELHPERPTKAELTAAAGSFLRAFVRHAGSSRLADETLHRYLIWCANDIGLPVQFHVGYGDRDVNLHQCNPLLLTPLIRELRVPVMLLHNYPFHREAGYLAQVFPHVYADIGLATHNLGARSSALLAEALELTPYAKFLFSSDAFGLPELYYLAAALFRRALAAHFEERSLRDASEAERIARLIMTGNARRVYRLGPG